MNLLINIRFILLTPGFLQLIHAYNEQEAGICISFIFLNSIFTSAISIFNPTGQLTFSTSNKMGNFVDGMSVTCVTNETENENIMIIGK